MDEKDKQIKKLRLQLAHERRKTYNVIEWVDNVLRKERVTGDRYLNWRKVSNKCRYSHVARMSAKYRPQPPKMDGKSKPALSVYVFDAVGTGSEAKCIAYTEAHARRLLAQRGISHGEFSRVEPTKQKTGC